ncbi:hypothetical protein GOP47_0017687 [Adiantum capillus-veneris]|uniref:HMA domain-containing protein n=1 Tax=Adiantum capillus-veneris TaxID=13818 RepID=A0A9D4UFW0_ADICA|nr:hypothetical protein GOP47_0017687 [Adiantum capillus-veneris]
MTKADSPIKPPAKLETITLKAFIHCEGCRRKIRRIIRVLDDVEDVVVDSTTGKVTVTGSNLDVKIIMQRLQKYGKQAEVWPSAGAGPMNASAKSAGGNQPKPGPNNGPSPSPSPNANSKKKGNAAGESGGDTKPTATGANNNEGKKGGGKKEEEASAKYPKGAEEAPMPSDKAEKSKPEKPKESNADSKDAGDANVPQHKGGNGNGGGGGGGKKGKKGGNNAANDGSNSSGGGDSILELPPPRIAQERPIANVPTTTLTVSANKSLAPNDYVQTGYSEYNSVEYATHMFSDENANNCSIM